ncbi:YagK/YfjJ domain-containing protein [Variovorax terrae]|uniref:Inovirus Gp2 family protein n=1 Tax=Variovorax terrae TaxID=2923278 RepID=A0A9X1VQQ6_9BURK|nr:inovirus-type Gp2 protein [Variovorax terrae]MCJ0761590.1 inovirus Gp2 family protein [Variovorax terrae]
MTIYKNDTFYKSDKNSFGNQVKKISKLGKHLHNLHRYAQTQTIGYSYHPLLNFFFQQYHQHMIKSCAGLVYCETVKENSTVADIFDEFVAVMREVAVKIKLRKAIASWESKINKNLQRINELEFKLFNSYPQLCVIRLDLYHQERKFLPEQIKVFVNKDRECSYIDLSDGVVSSVPRAVRVPIEVVQKDREHLFANMKGKPDLFRYLKGYVWRIEFTPRAGYHLHLVLFFDGSHVKDDQGLATKIGEYWRDKITQGDGYFDNVNMRRKERWGGTWVLGQIGHWELEKRANLRRYVLGYPCKTNQLVQVMPKKGTHLFGSGLVNRRKLEQRGRPRH